MGFFGRLLAWPYSDDSQRLQAEAVAQCVARPMRAARDGASAIPVMGPPERVVYLARDIGGALGRIASLRAHGIDVYVGLGMGIPEDAEVVIDAGSEGAALPFRHWAELLRPYGFSREILYLGHTASLIVEVNGTSPARRCSAPAQLAQLAWLKNALRPVRTDAEPVESLVH